MSVFHSMYHYFSKDGAPQNLEGIQAGQRDHSPFLVHFTSWKAMERIREFFDNNSPSKEIKKLLRECDEGSFQVAKEIILSGKVKLMSYKDYNKTDNAPYLSLTECNLSGLISHSERYGRFGFVFEKRAIQRLQGGPCLYLRKNYYQQMRDICLNHHKISGTKFKLDTVKIKQLWALCCPYSSAELFKEEIKTHAKKDTEPIQDYTHEREWRIFEKISLKDYLTMIILPKFYIAPIKPIIEEARAINKFSTPDRHDILLPIEDLFLMGA